MPRIRIGYDTGFPTQDAQNDFARARREQALSGLAAKLRGESSDVNLILPFDEVVEALGAFGEKPLGVQAIPIDAIVGTVDRGKDFDRHFRPTSRRPRQRWARIAAAMRRGEELPPIDVYRVGDLYFVRDGHHRVSAARMLERSTIDANVTLVRTRVGVERDLRRGDLPLKTHQRVFYERVPLPEEARGEIKLTDPWSYAVLAEAIEAWGFRLAQDWGEHLNRRQVAEEWLTREYRPVVHMLTEAGLLDAEQPTESYMRFSAERYRLARTQRWTPELLERVKRETR